MGFFNNLLTSVVKSALYTQKGNYERILNEPSLSSENRRLVEEKLAEVKGKLEQIRNYEDN